MKFIIYILISFLAGGIFKWYDLVWFNSSIIYLHYVVVSFFSLCFIVKAQESESVFKSLWQTIMSFVFISTIIAQVFIWLGYTDYGILKR